MTPLPRESSRSLPRISVAVISATALAYEVLLTRLFAIVQWHHFAYMVISIALLGFGASGTFLALNSRLVRRFRPAYIANLLLFGVSAMPAFLLGQRLAVHPEMLLWAPEQMLRVTVVYMLLALPFFFAANAIGLALIQFRHRVNEIYAADLVGAGLGGIAIIALLYLLFPVAALKLLGIAGAASALIAAAELRLGKHLAFAVAGVVLTTAVLSFVLPGRFFELAISPYKPLAQQLNVIDARVDTERSGPLGLLTVVRSPAVPLRHAPGLSLNTMTDIAEQLGVYSDADSLNPVLAGADRDDFGYLDRTTSALPYHLRVSGDVLILGAGGGSLVHQALLHRPGSVTAVELNPQLVALVRDDYRNFAGDVFDRDDVDVQIAEARGFLGRSPNRYDHIQLALLDSFGASVAGLYALNEGYLYTTEALASYYEKLNDAGYVAITRWMKLPPRDTLKMFATAIAALRQAGVETPEKNLLLIRSWQTSTLLIKRGAFNGGEIERARQFCETNAFDLAFYDGMPAALANRFNRLPEPYLYHGASSLLSADAAAYLHDYKFNIQPATDDRPYFSSFFKWRTLPEILELRGRGGVPMLESGYLILIVTLVQAVIISIALLVLPLRKRLRASNIDPILVTAYFAVLGLAFLFVEIAFIQKFMLFLHHPVVAVAVVLSSFLVFAGIGSHLAGRCPERQVRQLVIAASAAIGLLSVIYVFVLPELVFASMVAAPTSLRVLLSILLIGLLALPMGIPFPIGLSRLSARAPDLIPVAWAINGCASVISAVLATILAIHFGFTIVVLMAAALYGLAALIFRF